MDPRLPSLDELIVAFDNGLRTVFAPAQSVRPTPGASLPQVIGHWNAWPLPFDPELQIGRAHV